MSISISTKADRVKNVPARWKSQYEGWVGYGEYDKREITAKLLDLPAGFTAGEVDTIIGNTSWTEHKCEVCECDKDILAVLADNHGFDYESRSVLACPECLREALSTCEEAAIPKGGDA